MSEEFERALLGLDPDQTVVALLTLSHPGTTIRVSSDNRDTVSGGEIFASFPFAITLPSDVDGPVSARLEFGDPGSREVTEAIRSLTDPVQATIQLVLAATPDVIEIEYGGLELAGVSMDGLTISGSLAHPPIEEVPYPPARATMRDYPGLY
jgi:hypothetical protein